MLSGFDGAYDTVNKYKSKLKQILGVAVAFKVTSMLVHEFTAHFIKGITKGTITIDGKQTEVGQAIEHLGQETVSWFDKVLRDDVKDRTFVQSTLHKVYNFAKTLKRHPLIAIGIVCIATALLMIAAGVVDLSAEVSSQAKAAVASHSLFTSPKQVVKNIGNKLLLKYDALKSDPDFLLCVGFFISGVVCLVMGTRKLGG